MAVSDELLVMSCWLEAISCWLGERLAIRISYWLFAIGLRLNEDEDVNRIYYNLAEQGFKSSSRASVGVYNVSLQLAAHLSSAHCTALLGEECAVPALLADGSIRRVKADANGFRRVAWDQWGLYRAVDWESSDWLFLPKGYSSFVRKPPCCLAVYIHDVVHAYWRQAYKGYRSPLLHAYFSQGLKASLRNADVVFVNSDFTAGELRRFADHHRIKCLPPIITAGIGFDHLRGAPCADERKGVLVYVSSWPHKASNRLIPMLEQWQRSTGFPEPVYLLGTLPEKLDCPSFTNWIMLNTLPEEDYRDLLGRVRCTVFNSEYEGFGMPPGESLIQGAVPVYSSIPALNEVMLGTGFSYDNFDIDSFSEALNNALSVSRDCMDKWKNVLLSRHNWDSVIGRISQSLDQTVNK